MLTPETFTREDRVDIVWPDDDQYYSGEIVKVAEGIYQVTYVDGAIGVLVLSQKRGPLSSRALNQAPY